MKKPLPAQTRLIELFDYNTETGFITRKVRTANRTNVGDIAGDLMSSGYLRVGVDSQTYQVHRIIWKMIHGVDPYEIDHINHQRADNRQSNLREVSHLENGRNQKFSCSNTSGTMGVRWHKKIGKWGAYITVNRVHTHLGVFSHRSEAIAARKQAEIEHGFHQNHGLI